MLQESVSEFNAAHDTVQVVSVNDTTNHQLPAISTYSSILAYPALTS